jgi:hypothetical protein
MKKKLVGSTYGKFCKRFPQNRIKGEQQSVLALQHGAFFNIGAYWEMYNSFSKEAFQDTKAERGNTNP